MSFYKSLKGMTVIELGISKNLWQAMIGWTKNLEWDIIGARVKLFSSSEARTVKWCSKPLYYFTFLWGP